MHQVSFKFQSFPTFQEKVFCFVTIMYCPIHTATLPGKHWILLNVPPAESVS